MPTQGPAHRTAFGPQKMTFSILIQMVKDFLIGFVTPPPVGHFVIMLDATTQTREGCVGFALGEVMPKTGSVQSL